jgi:hypothetical protein
VSVEPKEENMANPKLKERPDIAKQNAVQKTGLKGEKYWMGEVTLNDKPRTTAKGAGITPQKAVDQAYGIAKKKTQLNP